MSSRDRQTVIIPIRLGPAAYYDPSVFPFARLKGNLGGVLHDEDIFLEATLDEIEDIRRMSKNMDSYDQYEEAKQLYDELMERRANVEKQSKSKNPIKIFARYRARRVLVQASRGLYRSTRRTSEAIRRALLSVASVDVVPTEAADGEGIAGVAVGLNGPLDDETAALIEDAANVLMSNSSSFQQDDTSDTRTTRRPSISTSSGSRSSTISSPTSTSSTSSTNYFNITYNNVHNTNMSSPGMTVNNGGSCNSGAVIHNVSFDPPS